MEKYIYILQRLFKNTKEKAGGKKFRFHHSCQVAHTARGLAQRLNLSQREVDIVFIAGLFHDVGKSGRVSLEGYLYAAHADEKCLGLERHEEVGARMVRDILMGDFDPEFIAAVSHIIQDETKEDILSQVLDDADNLSEMGAMNIWKMFSYSAYSERDVLETITYWEEEDKARHLKKKEALYLPESQKIAAQRIELTDDFMHRLKNELEGMISSLD
ncbi:MAG: HD domain-containing protein [Lactobacillales bacterium]|jgi:putative nucleotidyltransferase with HDIG domain|nr:HD domain-containing protein [Lactobacillales bacterium]